MPTNRNLCGNAVPHSMRKRHHRCYLDDHHTWLLRCGRRAERQIQNKLSGYIKAILEEQYAIILGKTTDTKIRKFVTKEVYPYNKPFDGQETVEFISWDGNSNRTYTEAEYETFLNTKPEHGVNGENKLHSYKVMQSGRITNGHGEFSHTDDHHSETFAMCERVWEVNQFTARFHVVEQFIVPNIVPNTPDTYTHQVKDITVHLVRVNKGLYDVWRFKKMIISDHEATKQPGWLTEFGTKAGQATEELKKGYENVVEELKEHLMMVASDWEVFRPSKKSKKSN